MNTRIELSVLDFFKQKFKEKLNKNESILKRRSLLNEYYFYDFQRRYSQFDNTISLLLRNGYLRKWERGYYRIRKPIPSTLTDYKLRKM